jgi:hypothetical protein
LLLIKGHLVSRQVEIDIKVAEYIRAEQTIERRGEDPRYRNRSDQNATPGYRNLSGSKAAQFDLVRWQVAADPTHFPLKFDARPLRANPLGDSRG